MLSSQEERDWEDVQRFWALESEEPPWLAPAPSRNRAARGQDLPVGVVAGAWITITLILFGAVLAGVSVGLASALGWGLWHYWPQLSGRGTTSTDRRSHEPADDG